jgi:hypothetical protein
MPRAEKVYRRLPGRTSGFLNYSRLWLGPDHLLFARTTVFSEEYKRFYFRDIQAVVTRRTELREILSAFFAFTAIVFGVLSIFTDPGWQIFLLLMAGAFFVALLVNWLRGPTCICHVRTAVQTEELSPLKRFRSARKVIDRLRPNIEKAQGPLAPELLRPNPPVMVGPAPAEAAAREADQPAPARDLTP